MTTPTNPIDPMQEALLLPCPFCGGEAKVHKVYGCCYPGCSNPCCAASIGEIYDAENGGCPEHRFHNASDATKAWNTRANIKPPPTPPTNPTQEGLLPCKICGSEHILSHHTHVEAASMECGKCGHASRYCNDFIEAHKVWNESNSILCTSPIKAEPTTQAMAEPMNKKNIPNPDWVNAPYKVQTWELDKQTGAIVHKTITQEPSPQSSSMPEEVKELFRVVEECPSRDPDGADLAWRLYVHAAFPHIKAAYARIEELEAENERFKIASACELGSQNQNLMHYMEHWETRAITAEEKLTWFEDNKVPKEPLGPKLAEAKATIDSLVEAGNEIAKHVQINWDIVSKDDALKCHALEDWKAATAKLSKDKGEVV